jgi:hypothetical protein
MYLVAGQPDSISLGPSVQTTVQFNPVSPSSLRHSLLRHGIMQYRERFTAHTRMGRFQGMCPLVVDLQSPVTTSIDFIALAHNDMLNL